MSGARVVVDEVWKKFRKGQRHDSLRDWIPAMAKQAVHPQPAEELRGQEFWALQNVSFAVRPGEALGIVGPNGGGKSTILKLLTRILEPTRGRCSVHGRIGALIEIAAGFHGDLTGRENIYLQGAILGMKRERIAEKFDQIVEFAGLPDFIDTQVKHYSSGMNARLGFSIAAHLDPEVMLIDEVLGVGDTAFQQKCSERLLDFKQSGVAIVFISHNPAAIAKLCDTALFLNGEPRAYGETATVLEQYLSYVSAANALGASGVVAVQKRGLTHTDGRPVVGVSPGTPLISYATWRALKPVSQYRMAFRVYRSTDGLPVFDASWRGDELGLPAVEAGTEVTVTFQFVANLTRGHYHLAFHIYHDPTRSFIAHERPTAAFIVEEERTYEGVADLEVQPRVDSRAQSPGS